MAEEKAGWFGRVFKRKAATEKQMSHLAARDAVPVKQPTIGLNFDYARGLDFENDFLSDDGLKRIMATLKRYGLRATFNCPAKLCELASDQITMIAEAGHEIAVMGYNNESPKELTQDAIKQMLFACRNAFRQRGLHPIGFRSPFSHWTEGLCEELSKQQFLYNAEHDHAKNPYVLVPGEPPLLRIPIYTDDRGLRRREKTYNATVSKHHRLIRRAMTGKHFVSICFHRWLLAEEQHRMDHWEDWLESAVKSGSRLCAMEDVIPEQYRNITPSDD